MKILIKVREYGGAYIARSAFGKTASSTNAAQYAALKVALKVAQHTNPRIVEGDITLKRVDDQHFTAKWTEIKKGTQP